MVRIFLFGSPQILLEERAIRLSRRKSRALLYYLAAHPRPLTRAHLLSVFWPDVPRPAALTTLRATLYSLRKTLGEALQAEDTQVGLSAQVEVDVRQFEAALSSHTDHPGGLAQAVDLYRGEFLADFYLEDAPAFEDWVVSERERLRRMAMRGLERLARLYEQNKDYASALACLERALSFDPLQEDVQRESMRLLYLAGDRPAAIRRYDQLRRLLDEEMGVPPMRETRRLYDAILNDSLPPASMQMGKEPVRRPTRVERSPALPFTGRQEELKTLQELRGSHKLALIEGEAGIGKTRLAQEFIRLSGALPLVGAAHELEGVLPYQPVIDALRTLLSRAEWPALYSRLELSPVWRLEIGRLLPELSEEAFHVPRGASPRAESLARPELPAAGESRLWEGIHRFLVALSRQQPLIFFIDDVQWADAATLSLLGYLLRQDEGQIDYLAASRPAAPRLPLTALLQALLRAGRLARISLSRLSKDEVGAIARQISPLYAYPLADWLARSSEGNPYMLAELIRYGREQGFLRPDGQVNLSALPSAPVAPPTIFNLIQMRLARLSEPARRALDAAATMGREFDFEAAAHAAGLSENATLDALDELRLAGLIAPLQANDETDAGRSLYSFDHSLTIEVAYREMGEARHRLLHRRVAEAMETIYHHRLEAVAGLIAWHYREGNAPERAAPYAFRAGQWAAGLAAWKEAIEFYEQALAVDRDGQRRLEILVALGEAQFNAGQMPQASETLRAALRLAEPGSAQAARIRLTLARTLLPQARFAEAIELAQAVLGMQQAEFAVQAEYLWGTALSLEGADLEAAAAHLRRAEERCAAQANPAHLAHIQFELGSIAAQQGDLARAVALYHQALAAAQQAAAEENSREAAQIELALIYNNLAYHLHLMGDPQAGEYARMGLALAQDKGILTVQPYLLSTLGEIALAAGDVEAAEHFFDQGLALAERLSMPERVAGLTANLGLAAGQRGQDELAIHRLSTALAQADALGTRHLAAQIRLWLAPLLPAQQARRRLTEARLIAEASGRRRLLEQALHLEAELNRRAG